MTANDGSIIIRFHLTVRAVVPVGERMVVYPRAGVFLDETDHLGSKTLVCQGGCRPELPISLGIRGSAVQLDSEGGEFGRIPFGLNIIHRLREHVETEEPIRVQVVQ